MLSAALLRPWCSTRGVELCARRHVESEQLLWRWREHVAPTLNTNYQRLGVTIQLVHGNILDLTHLDWSDADVVYVHATCFGSALLASLAELMGHLRPGSLILSVGKPLISHNLQALFAWGCVMSYSVGPTVPVYIQRRRPYPA